MFLLVFIFHLHCFSTSAIILIFGSLYIICLFSLVLLRFSLYQWFFLKFPLFVAFWAFRTCEFIISSNLESFWALSNYSPFLLCIFGHSSYIPWNWQLILFSFKNILFSLCAFTWIFFFFLISSGSLFWMSNPSLISSSEFISCSIFFISSCLLCFFFYIFHLCTYSCNHLKLSIIRVWISLSANFDIFFLLGRF